MSDLDRFDSGWRLYLLLALFDRRDGSVLSNLVYASRAGYERTSMGANESQEAWDEFDAIWNHYTSAERLELLGGV